MGHAPDAAVDNVVDAEVASGNKWIDVRASITHHAACRAHDETLHIAQTSDKCVGESDAEILVTCVICSRTENSERQHGDRFVIYLQLAGNRRKGSETMVQLAQQVVETWVA